MSNWKYLVLKECSRTQNTKGSIDLPLSSMQSMCSWSLSCEKEKEKKVPESL